MPYVVLHVCLPLDYNNLIVLSTIRSQSLSLQSFPNAARRSGRRTARRGSRRCRSGATWTPTPTPHAFAGSSRPGDPFARRVAAGRRASYPTETVLSNKITKNRIVLSFKDSPRKPLGWRTCVYATHRKTERSC